jgi:hypothetical protein
VSIRFCFFIWLIAWCHFFSTPFCVRHKESKSDSICIRQHVTRNACNVLLTAAITFEPETFFEMCCDYQQQQQLNLKCPSDNNNLLCRRKFFKYFSIKLIFMHFQTWRKTIAIIINVTLFLVFVINAKCIFFLILFKWPEKENQSRHNLFVPSHTTLLALTVLLISLQSLFRMNTFQVYWMNWENDWIA